MSQPEFLKQLSALGVNVSRETLQRLETYAALLTKWQAKINLVGPATLPEMWTRHFLDSAQLIPLFDSLPRLGGGGTLVDLGSGAGFPGLVLAICRPDLAVHLIDSDQRKCAFLRQVALETGTKALIHTRRIAEVTGVAADVVTARACAPLGELLDLASPFVGEKGTCLFLKGAQADEELTQAERRWMMRLDRRASVTDPEASILVIGDLKRKG